MSWGCSRLPNCQVTGGGGIGIPSSTVRAAADIGSPSVPFLIAAVHHSRVRHGLEGTTVILYGSHGSDENNTTTSELDRGVCEDLGRSMDSGMVAVYMAICIFRGMLTVSS